MPARLSNKKFEGKILSLLFKSPFHLNSLNMEEDLFSLEPCKSLFLIVKEYVKKYKAVPTVDTIKTFLNSLNGRYKPEKAVEILNVLDALPGAKEEEFQFYLDKLENYRVGRHLFDMNVGFGKDIESNEEVDFIRIKKDNLSKLFGMDTSSAEIQEGFLSENTEKRLDIYKEVATKGLTDVIPFGIKSLDDSLQGFKRGFLMLVYAKTAGGKTTFAINIAHNVANLGFSVMYVSLEMSYENISAKFDALESRLDSNKIMFGKLTPEELVQYEEALKKQKEKNARLFICDVKRNATMSMICAEIEKYKNKNGKVPDLIVVDYANLLEPTKVYKDRSSKYDYLLKEMHENAKYFNAAFLTMMQESRDSTKTDLTQGRRKKEDNSDEDGVHRIGLSHYAATHCEYVLRLKQMKEDKLRNRIHLIVDKYRYGKSGSNFPLFMAPEISYIGDRSISLVGEKLDNCKENQYTEQVE